VFLFFLPFYVASSVDVSFVMVVHVVAVTGECALIVCACFDHHVHVHAPLPPLLFILFFQNLFGFLLSMTLEGWSSLTRSSLSYFS